MGRSDDEFSDFGWRKRKLSWQSKLTLSGTVSLVALLAYHGVLKTPVLAVVMVVVQAAGPTISRIGSIRKQQRPPQQLCLAARAGRTPPEPRQARPKYATVGTRKRRLFFNCGNAPVQVPGQRLFTRWVLDAVPEAAHATFSRRPRGSIGGDLHACAYGALRGGLKLRKSGHFGIVVTEQVRYINRDRRTCK